MVTLLGALAHQMGAGLLDRGPGRSGTAVQQPEQHRALDGGDGEVGQASGLGAGGGGLVGELVDVGDGDVGVPAGIDPTARRAAPAGPIMTR
jgi:hypothetical protein